VPLLDRIRSFLTSPQGRRLTDQGRRYASDPRRRQQARDLLTRLRRPRWRLCSWRSTPHTSCGQSFHL